MFQNIVFLTSILLFSSFAVSQQVEEPVKKLGSYDFLDNVESLNSIQDYQIGDEWGKILVTEEVMGRSEAIRRAAMGTVKVGGATGFVLGDFEGDMVIATNHHVCPSSNSWTCTRVSIPQLNMTVNKKDFLGTWKNIDLTLLTVRVSDEQRRQLQSVAKNFDFHAALTPGLPLITSGFGRAGNGRAQMMINFDSDCRVISRDLDFRLISDPDGKNPADYQAWSFSNGCDVSHGDSGSAMVDATTGSPIGIIWTGRIPKSHLAQSSSNVLKWQKKQTDHVWQELSYAVPAKKIQEYLRERLSEGDIEQQYRGIISAVIRN